MVEQILQTPGSALNGATALPRTVEAGCSHQPRLLSAFPVGAGIESQPYPAGVMVAIGRSIVADHSLVRYTGLSLAYWAVEGCSYYAASTPANT